MNKKVNLLIASAALRWGVNKFIVTQRVEAKKISVIYRKPRLESRKSNHEIDNNKSDEKVNEAIENVKNKIKVKFEEANKKLKKLAIKHLEKHLIKLIKPMKYAM